MGMGVGAGMGMGAGMDMSMGMGGSFQYLVDIGMSIGMIFQNRHGCRYSPTYAEPLPSPLGSLFWEKGAKALNLWEDELTVGTLAFISISKTTKGRHPPTYATLL